MQCTNPPQPSASDDPYDTSSPQLSADNYPYDASSPRSSADNYPYDASSPQLSASDYPYDTSSPQLSASDYPYDTSSPQLSANNDPYDTSPPQPSAGCVVETRCLASLLSDNSMLQISPTSKIAPLSRICNSARNIRQFVIDFAGIAKLPLNRAVCSRLSPRSCRRDASRLYGDSGIDYRIANPDDVPSGNTITCGEIASLSCRSTAGSVFSCCPLRN
ncbi:MAG: hypothetical protein LBL04_16545 [Bacteroidales bacterium]|jgi:hypothetical protein|nr:hypothetical protein [Bacteroidales bacterium]